MSNVMDEKVTVGQKYKCKFIYIYINIYKFMDTFKKLTIIQFLIVLTSR